MAYAQVLSSSYVNPSSFNKVLPKGFRQSKGLSSLVVNSKIDQAKQIHILMEMQRESGSITKDHLGFRVPHVLTVAGSDSGAGAGIQADLKACAARGVYCSTVITAVTAQNTVGVQGVDIVPEDFVAQQLRSVLSDMQVDV